MLLQIIGFGLLVMVYWFIGLLVYWFIGLLVYLSAQLSEGGLVYCVRRREAKELWAYYSLFISLHQSFPIPSQKTFSVLQSSYFPYLF
jgi:hypothetical protein